MFTLHTLKEFSHVSGFKHASRSLIALSGFLYSNGKIPKPLTTPRRLIDLPDPFNSYLRQQSHKASFNTLRQIKGFLASFYDYLEKHSILLASSRSRTSISSWQNSRWLALPAASIDLICGDS